MRALYDRSLGVRYFSFGKEGYLLSVFGGRLTYLVR